MIQILQCKKKVLLPWDISYFFYMVLPILRIENTSSKISHFLKTQRTENLSNCPPYYINSHFPFFINLKTPLVVILIFFFLNWQLPVLCRAGEGLEGRTKIK